MAENRVRVALIDHIRGTKTHVEVPNNVPMNRMIPALVSKLGLPTEQNGQPIVYRMDHLRVDENGERVGERIGEEQTLADANVQSEASLSLFPEVTAGGRDV